MAFFRNSLTLALLLPFLARAEDSTLFTVTLDPGGIPRQDALVCIPHGEENVPDHASGAIFAREGSTETLQADLDPANRACLWLRVPGEIKPGESLRLVCRGWVQDTTSPPDGAAANFVFKDAEGREMFVYHAAPDPAPEGTSPLYVRSGFIHPLASPDGSIVTGTRPADHYHHMGLWHAWTLTKFRDKKVDFWNLKDATGTVRFREYAWRHRGRAWSGFAAIQDHIAWPGTAEETKVLEETLVVRAWKAGKLLFLDYEFEQKNVAAEPLELEVYRYGGGLGFRGRHDWKKDNSDYLTSEGKTRADAFQTRAKWVAVSGPTESGPAGAAMLGHGSNPDAPQRLRTWGDDHGGAIFANFVPTQEKAATLAPGQSMRQRYRVVTFQGMSDPSVLNAVWADYDKPVQATVSR